MITRGSRTSPTLMQPAHTEGRRRRKQPRPHKNDRAYAERKKLKIFSGETRRKSAARRGREGKGKEKKAVADFCASEPARAFTRRRRNTRRSLDVARLVSCIRKFRSKSRQLCGPRSQRREIVAKIYPGDFRVEIGSTASLRIDRLREKH